MATSSQLASCSLCQGLGDVHADTAVYPHAGDVQDTAKCPCMHKQGHHCAQLVQPARYGNEEHCAARSSRQHASGCAGCCTASWCAAKPVAGVAALPVPCQPVCQFERHSHSGTSCRHWATQGHRSSCLETWGTVCRAHGINAHATSVRACSTTALHGNICTRTHIVRRAPKRSGGQAQDS
jgi:hypothetical protein